jgi:trk system potassium uptake protein TrkA
MAKRIFIIGGGRFGVHLATRLSEFGCEVELADSSAQRVKELTEDGFHAVEMDASDEHALKDSGALEADVVVVAAGESMQASILATLLLKQFNARWVVARAADVRHAQVLARLGADDVVLPTRDMAYQLAERLRDDARSPRIPLADDYHLAEIRLGPVLHGQTLAEAQLPKRYGVTAVLYKRATGDRTTVEEIKADLILANGSALLVVGRREKVNRFEHECGPQR